MDWSLALDLVAVILILAVLRGLVEIRGVVQAEVAQLDQKLAQALQSLVEGGLEGFEPPNPIQQAIAQMLSSRMAAIPPAPSELIREADGTFTSPDNS